MWRGGSRREEEDTEDVAVFVEDTNLLTLSRFSCF